MQMHWGLIGAALLVALLMLTSSAWAEQSELVWEYRFDAPAEQVWELRGDAKLAEGVLETRGNRNERISAAFSEQEEPIPTADNGYWLRLEYAVTPVKLSSMGQTAGIWQGPITVAFGLQDGDPVATLNRGTRVGTAIAEGRQVTVSCDFTREAVLSWRINGEEQLGDIVPAGYGEATTARVMLADMRWGGESVSHWHWARLSRVYPDDDLRLRLTRWEDLREVESGQAAAFMVGQASPMLKVFREAADFSGSFDPHVSIAAAGRERESFQLVVVPVGEALRDVRVAVSDLLHADGATRLPAAQVSWYRVGYVQTQPSRSAIRRVGWWWPDVLLPPEPFDADLGYVQPIWLTVDVPPDQEPGRYRGLITVSAAEHGAHTIGLELTVRPFSLPVRGRLRTAFCMEPITWEFWHRPNETRARLGLTLDQEVPELRLSRETEDVIPHEKWVEVYDFLLAHRLSPTSIYSPLTDGQARVIPGREDMQYCYDRGMNATCLVNVEKLPDDPAAADQYMRDLEAYLADWNRFIQEKNWRDLTWYVHGFDESDGEPNHEETQDPSIRRVFGMMGERFPLIKRESANPLNPDHIGLFDIWTPLTSQWTARLEERQAAGDEVWAYVCAGPGKPFANFFTDFPGVDPRILPWQLYQHDVTGFLYYMLDYYATQENKDLAGPKWPARPWNALTVRSNNDGVLIYPGPDATPLASTRLENLRDGIEDYEALAMLADLTTCLEEAGGHDETIAQAHAALAVRPELTTSWTEYTLDPDVIVRARAEVDAMIAAAMMELGAYAEGP
jgi:hypothetical protein